VNPERTRKRARAPDLDAPSVTVAILDRLARLGRVMLENENPVAESLGGQQQPGSETPPPESEGIHDEVYRESAPGRSLPG
jgi:hypothetical protein